MQLPERLTLDDPGPFLQWLGTGRTLLNLDEVRVAEIWSLVAAAALARVEQAHALRVNTKSQVSNVCRFAHAVGLDTAIAGARETLATKPDRTVPITRVHAGTSIEHEARRISSLVVPDHSQEDTRRAVRYVLVELLRNVLQHSQDRLGGVVAAQLNDGGRHTDRPTIQVGVADAGIGIFESLRPMHPKLIDAREALEKALWPHFSGTFEEGLTGTIQNAGMGLFFISEMAKLLRGKLLLASRGSALLLEGEEDVVKQGRLGFVGGPWGFPGTLVAFELPVNEVKDYAGLMEVIRVRAKERTPAREIHRWFNFEPAPPDAFRMSIVVAAEDVREAAKVAKDVLEPKLIERKPLALDFSRFSVLTQSFAHALLFEPLRLAWALRTPIYIENAQPAVRSNLELLENYALGG
jgi:hypothetical protein